MQQELTVAATNENLDKVLQMAAEAAEECGFSNNRINEFQVAVEEAFVNIVRHAYDTHGECTIQCRTEKDTVILTLIDSGREFDPVTAKDPKIDQDVEQRPLGGLGILLIIALAGGLLCSLASRSLTRPIDVLVDTMERIQASGLQGQTADPGGAAEFRELGHIFNSTLDELHKAMDDLAKTTAAKQKIESELRVAHDIQATILPKIIPPFPDRTEFQIHAILESARAVGGDFYDLFFIDEDHFCFSLGDVSDKGVPASLFMAVTKTLLKAAVLAGQSPEEAMANVNRELAHDHDMCMFATVFLGIIEVSTGKVSYVNAGHCLPVVQEKSGKTSFMQPDHNIVIGAAEDASYKPGLLELAAGSSLLLYSDGITEAMNPAEQEFGEERLIDLVTPMQGVAPPEMATRIHREVRSFTRGAPQSDDITLLTLKYYGT